MKRYRVLLAYRAYNELEVEANNEKEAIEAAEKRVSSGRFDKVKRHPSKDLVEEILDAPEEGDFIISPNTLLNTVTVSIKGGGWVVFCGEEQYEEALAYIRNRMHRKSHYPSVWKKGDNGSLSLIDVYEE